MHRPDNEAEFTEWDFDLLALYSRMAPLQAVIPPVSTDALAPLPPDIQLAWTVPAFEAEPAAEPFVTPFPVEAESQQDILDKAAVTEDPKAAVLHRDAYALYQTANKAYQNDTAHKFPFIEINQGVRSTAEQARLYEAYYRYLTFGGPVANPANQPGKSLHEYGFAIDVIRGDDETLLVSSLEGADWERINADEGWHFEARGAASFATVQTAIQTQVVPVATRYVNELDRYLRLRQQYDQQSPAVLAEEQRLRTEEISLHTAAQALALRTQDLQRRLSQLQQESAALNRAAADINGATQRYNAMVYNLCPNHEPFEKCTHTELKNQWLADKKAAYDAIVRMQNQYNADRARYQAEYAQYNTDTPILAQDKAAYQRREQTFQHDQAASRQARAKLNAMLTQSQQHRSTAATLVGTLTTLVGNIRAGL